MELQEQSCQARVKPAPESFQSTVLPSHAWQVTGRHANRHETISRHNFHTHTATQATVDNSNTAAFELRNDEQSREGEWRVGHGGLACRLTERVGWVLQLLHHICEARAACRVLVPARFDQRNDFWAVSLGLSRNRRPAASFDEFFDLLRVVNQHKKTVLVHKILAMVNEF